MSSAAPDAASISESTMNGKREGMRVDVQIFMPSDIDDMTVSDFIKVRTRTVRLVAQKIICPGESREEGSALFLILVIVRSP